MIRELEHTRKSAFAPSTWSNLRTQWKAYLEFCTLASLFPCPLSPLKLSLFAQHLSSKVKSPATVANYLSGVRSLSLIAGGDPPPLSHPLIKYTLTGLKRIMKHVPKRASPITPQILREVFHLLDFSNSLHCSFWSFCLLSFYLLTRKSNMVPTKQSAFNPTFQLCWSDIVRSDQAAIVSLKWSKTNQFSTREIKIPLLANPNSCLCPINALKLMARINGGVPSQSPFSYVHKGSTQILTYPVALSMLRTVIFATGRNGRLFSCHSLRRGGASFAYVSGLRDLDIQILGDWRSDCYKIYLQGSVQDRIRSAAKIRDAISNS